MKLYELANDFAELERLVDSGEFTHEHVADTLEGIELSIDEKITALLKIRQQCLANAKSLDDEATRVINLCKSQESKAESISEYIKLNMLKLNRDKIDLGLFKLTLRKATKKLGDIDESKIGDAFFVTVPESKKLDRRALLSAAKSKPIDGVELVDSERSLTVK